MTIQELLWCFLENFSCFIFVISILSTLTCFFSMIMKDIASKRAGKISMVVGLIFTCLMSVATLIPNSDTLVRVRLNLVKAHLLTKPNVEKGAEEIHRIARKLECKYLGGCNENP